MGAGEKDVTCKLRGVAAVLAIVLFFFASTACWRERHLHIRGALDRTNWIVRPCKSDKAYRVVMSSGAWAQLVNYQKRFNVTDSDPLMIEFDGTTSPLKWPWSARETIAIDCCSIEFQRGPCQ